MSLVGFMVLVPAIWLGRMRRAFRDRRDQVIEKRRAALKGRPP